MTDAREFPATLDALPEISAWAGAILRSAGVSEERVPAAEIAVVEAASNVARHAFGNAGGRLTVEAVTAADAVRLTLVDAGPPFDPVAAMPRTRQGDEQHGMGLSIIRDAATAIAYERREGRNRFTLVFARSGA